MFHYPELSATLFATAAIVQGADSSGYNQNGTTAARHTVEKRSITRQPARRAAFDVNSEFSFGGAQSGTEHKNRDTFGFDVDYNAPSRAPF